MIGTAPLMVAVMVAGARVSGLDGAADALGCLYLIVATLSMSLCRAGGAGAGVNPG